MLGQPRSRKEKDQDKDCAMMLSDANSRLCGKGSHGHSKTLNHLPYGYVAEPLGRITDSRC